MREDLRPPGLGLRGCGAGSVDEPRVAELLHAAGLQLLSGAVPAGAPPLTSVGLLSSCGPEDGRRDAWVDGWVNEETPGLVERANAGWLALAEEHGLFGPDREFLLGVQVGEEREDGYDTSRWQRVRLLEKWDLVGAGAETGLLGSGAGRPGFRMCSLDGRVPVLGTTYQKGVTSIVVPELWRAPSMRRTMDRLVERAAHPNRADVSDWERGWAREWLQYLCHHGRAGGGSFTAACRGAAYRGGRIHLRCECDQYSGRDWQASPWPW
jgi:hypothetical protein